MSLEDNPTADLGEIEPYKEQFKNKREPHFLQRRGQNIN